MLCVTIPVLECMVTLNKVETTSNLKLLDQGLKFKKTKQKTSNSSACLRLRQISHLHDYFQNANICKN